MEVIPGFVQIGHCLNTSQGTYPAGLTPQLPWLVEAIEPNRACDSVVGLECRAFAQQPLQSGASIDLGDNLKVNKDYLIAIKL